MAGERPAVHAEPIATTSPAEAQGTSEPPPPSSLHPGGRDSSVRSAAQARPDRPARRDATAEATAARTTLAVSRDAGGPTTGPLAALQALREQLAAGVPPAREAFVAILERELPQDWARRRALAALFARGLPPRADEALELVGRLTTAASRRWALSDLAASRPWADEDFARLVAAADTPALRRRLSNRRPAS